MSVLAELGNCYIPYHKSPTLVQTHSGLHNSGLFLHVFPLSITSPLTAFLFDPDSGPSASACIRLRDLTLPGSIYSIHSRLHLPVIRSYYTLYWTIICFHVAPVPDLLYLCLGYSSPDFWTLLYKPPCSHT